MDRWVGKVAVVTGASAGIGAKIVESLVREGVKVVGLARRIEKMEELSVKLIGEKGKFYPIECDVQKEDDIMKAFKWVEEELGGLQILVNNAAVMTTGMISESSTETFRKLLEVNFLAFAICSRETIKSIKKHNTYGHIIVVNSIGGHNADLISRPVNIYCASKYAISGMTISLRNELAIEKLKVKVTGINPGLVNTDMPANAGMPREILEQEVSLKTKDIADAVIYVLATPPNVQISDLTIVPLEPLSVAIDSVKKTDDK